MEQIFTARNEMEAHFVQGLLEQDGIDSVIQGEALEGAWANLPLSDKALPSIWVNEADSARAAAIVGEYEQRGKKTTGVPTAETPRPTWKCPKCGEEVEEQFDECWNCGATKPGTEGENPGPQEPAPVSGS
jgi:hypothetical protein